MNLLWRISDTPIPYEEALAWMEAQVAGVIEKTAPESVWLLEHPPLYTAGTSAHEGDLLLKDRFPVYTAGRGGQYTYHGPGQRVAYVIRDLKCHAGEKGPDLRAYIFMLEEWLIETLKIFGIKGERRADRVGIWVVRPGGREEKIAAIGVRVRKWVTYHGIALNVDPDLSHFAGIVPCGITAHGVTSMAALGVKCTMKEIDQALKDSFHTVFKE